MSDNFVCPAFTTVKQAASEAKEAPRWRSQSVYSLCGDPKSQQSGTFTRSHYASATDWPSTSFTPGARTWCWERHKVHKHAGGPTGAGWDRAAGPGRPRPLAGPALPALIFTATMEAFEDSNPILNSFDYWSWFIHFAEHVTTATGTGASPRLGPVFLLDPKTRRGTNLIDYQYETARPMCLNLTRVQIQYIWYFFKK